MGYSIKIEPEALKDIQEGIHWYNDFTPGSGRKFHAEVKEKINVLKSYPNFQIRYDNVRCLPLEKYRYMIHFTIDEENKTVIIRAVFHTSKDPKIWKKRQDERS